mmetsp:Transcript_158313/g.288721  ORF Transcript_158313/g.288721 Transcript_158313/m.288721 type:complete len:469 (-) Transcript_158313:47-1453(-)
MIALVVIVSILGLLIVVLIFLQLADFLTESFSLVTSTVKYGCRCCRWMRPLCCLLVSLVFLLVWYPVRIILLVPVIVARRITLARLPETMTVFENGISSKQAAVHPLQLIIEFPLTLISFLLYRTARGILHGARWAWNSMDERSSSEGELITSCHWSNFLEKDAALNGGMHLSRLAIMTMMFMGPRWNTHGVAYQAVLSALSDQLVFEVENLKRDGFWWHIRFYNSKGIEVAGVTSSSENVEFVTVEISQFVEDEPISIYIHVYYYGGNQVGQLPAMRLDGEEVIPRRDCNINTANFQMFLRLQQNSVHAACQWYMFSMLALQHHLPVSYVKEDMLAAVKDTTITIFGVAFEGFCLNITTEQAVLKEHVVFCTVYSRASMPTVGRIEVTTPKMKLRPCTEESIWLIRIISRRAGPVDPKVSNKMKVELTRNLEGLHMEEKVVMPVLLPRAPEGEEENQSEPVADKKNE